MNALSWNCAIWSLIVRKWLSELEIESEEWIICLKCLMISALGSLLCLLPQQRSNDLLGALGTHSSWPGWPFSLGWCLIDTHIFLLCYTGCSFSDGHISFLDKIRPYWITVLLGLVSPGVLISLYGSISLLWLTWFCIPILWGQLTFFSFLPSLTF